MIRRLKRQTKHRHSVIGGRKLYKRTVIQMLADRVAKKVAARVAVLLGLEGASETQTITVEALTEPIIGARYSPDVWTP